MKIKLYPKSAFQHSGQTRNYRPTLTFIHVGSVGIAFNRANGEAIKQYPIKWHIVLKQTTHKAVPMDALEQVLAINALHQLKARYCRLLDTKQWALLEKLFMPDTIFHGFTSAPVGTDPTTFVANIAKRFEGAITVHHVQAPEIKFVGPGKARGVWSMMDYADLRPDAGSSVDPAGRGWIG